MKEKIISLILILIPFFCIAQDVIKFKNGDVYRVKIKEVGDSLVFVERGDGRRYNINREFIESIRYEDLKDIVFKNLRDTNFVKTSSRFMERSGEMWKLDTTQVFYRIKDKSFNDFVLKGEADAYLHRNYDKYYRAPFLTTTFLPPIGIIVTYAMLLTPPQVDERYVPDQNLLKEEAYLYGYKQRSYKEKKTRTVKGFSLGVICGSVLWYLILK